MKNLFFILLAATSVAHASRPPCAIQVLDSKVWEGVRIPKDFIPYLVTPRLLIGRKQGEEPSEWLRLVARDTMKVVGSMGVTVIGKSAHIPIYLDRYIRARNGDLVGERMRPARIGEGFGSEAKQAAIDYVFDRLGVEKVFARVVSSNERSLAFHRRLGFQAVEEEAVPEDFQIISYRDDPIRYFVLNRADRKTNPYVQSAFQITQTTSAGK